MSEIRINPGSIGDYADVMAQKRIAELTIGDITIKMLPPLEAAPRARRRPGDGVPEAPPEDAADLALRLQGQSQNEKTSKADET